MPTLLVCRLECGRSGAHTGGMASYSRRQVIQMGSGTGLLALVAACSSPESSRDLESGAGKDSEASASTPPAQGEWQRISLGSVSAYLLVRSGEAALVDTGNPGSEEDVAAMLDGAGLGWADLSSVILTHSHGDHVGSAAGIAELAPDAVFFAGTPDLRVIDIGREVSGLWDQDSVFGLTVIATPGHTPGHIALLDSERSVLLAGDALVSTQGALDLPNPQYTPDYDEALRSVELLGQLTFDSAYVGHGEPVLSGADGQVRALAQG